MYQKFFAAGLLFMYVVCLFYIFCHIEYNPCHSAITTLCKSIKENKLKFKFSKESNQMFHDNGFGKIFSLKIICIIYMLEMFLSLQYFYKFWHG